MTQLNVEGLSIATQWDGAITMTCNICKESAKAAMIAAPDLHGKKLCLDLKQWRKRRSMDANAYLWALCDKIADALKVTKELVYKDFIRDVGVYDIILARNDTIETFMSIWNSRGLGWFAEIMDGSKVDNCTRVMVYSGSSTYDTKQMSRLLDYAIQTAEDLGIPTLPDTDIRAMKASWGNEKKQSV